MTSRIPPTGPNSPTRSRLPGLLRRLVAIVLPTLSIPMLGPLALLALIAETWAGRLVGWLAVAMLAAIICAVGLIWPWPRPRIWASCLGICLLLTVGLMVALVRYQPARGPAASPVGLQSVVLGRPKLMRPGLIGLLPEIDLVKLGATIMSRLIPGTTADHRRRIRDETLRLSREIVADPGGRGLPSVNHLALAELLGRPFDAGHYYAYIPAKELGHKPGAIVFLHGNAGNFKINPWAWRGLAEGRQLVILCPTYGFGFWGEGGVEAVDAALDDAIRRFSIDPARVYLAGLSDGGQGVTRSGHSHPSRYRGLIYISPTMNLGELGSADFMAAWRGRPVLVLQGDRDVNVLKSTVDPAVDLLRSGRIEVTYRVFPGEDHFLFFGRSADVFTTIAAWMDLHD